LRKAEGAPGRQADSSQEKRKVASPADLTYEERTALRKAEREQRRRWEGERLWTKNRITV
jgi:hypothetical protein